MFSTNLRSEAGGTLIELMVALVVLGIVMVGTVDGLALISRQTTMGGRAVGVQQAVREALMVLENLPDNSAYLADDGPGNDLYDTATPDHVKNPMTGAATWEVSTFNGGARTTYRILYNVRRDVLLTNTVIVKVFAFWESPGGRQDYVERTLIRPVTPL